MLIIGLILMNKSFGILFICVLLLSCEEADELAGKNFDYALINISNVEVGLKILSVAPADDFTVLKELFVLKPGENEIFLKSKEQKNSAVFIHSIEVYDKEFKDRYKVLNLGDQVIEGNTVKLGVWLPDPNSKAITANNTGVNIYMDESSIYGTFPLGQITPTLFFFNTTNDFQTITQTQLSGASADNSTIGGFGQTMINWDSNPHSQSTNFRISSDNGNSWSNLFSVFMGADRDFLTADFINAQEGWFFTYNYWDSTLVYKVSGNDYAKISKLRGYCVVASKFISSTKGYLIANNKDNISPSTAPTTYFFRTTDGGLTWDEPKLITETESPQKLFAFSSGKLRIVRGNNFQMQNTYFSSENDGELWEVIEPQIEGKIRDLYFLSADIGFIKTGVNGLWSQSNPGFVYKTNDGGKTWKKIQSESLLGSKIYFFNEQIGFLQDLIYGKGQVLLVTRDGGQTWKEVLYPYSYTKMD